MKKPVTGENHGYRHGVVLGLTIAEIILLIMFALLLAMSAVLLKRKSEIESRVSAQSLPREVAEKLVGMQINLSKRDDQQRLLAILNDASKNQEDNQQSGKALKLGTEIQDHFGQQTTARQLIKSMQELKDENESLKAEVKKTGTAKILPPCYRDNKSDPTPFVYDIRVKPNGFMLTDAVPEKLRSRFDSEFGSPMPTKTLINDKEFQQKSRSLVDYGKRHQCKFYVKVYDETGSRDKLPGMLKVIENSFVWTLMISSVPNDGDLNLFPVAPVRSDSVGKVK